MGKKQKYYKVSTKDGHSLGFTTNKYAFQRNSGWKMNQLKFKIMYK